MPVLDLPAPTLANLAMDRAFREDIGITAIWHYPAKEPKGKLLFIHGFRGDHHGLSATAGALVDYEVLIPDLPGYGKTPELKKHDLESYADWLINLVDQIGPDVVVLGHSFGSLVVSKALELGLPAAKVILLNPISTRSQDQVDLANKAARWFYRFTERTGAAGSLLLRSPRVSALRNCRDGRLTYSILFLKLAR